MAPARVFALSSLVVLAVGCGAAAKAPSVASLGGVTTTRSSSGPIVPRNGSFLKFVNCLRAHGVSAQVGQGGHGVAITAGAPGSSKMSAAQTACQKFLPGGPPKPLTPEQQEQQLEQLVKLAKCMRKHGVPAFPDPSTSGGFPFPKSAVGGPGFERAAKACGAAGPNGKGFAIRARVP